MTFFGGLPFPLATNKSSHTCLDLSKEQATLKKKNLQIKYQIIVIGTTENDFVKIQSKTKKIILKDPIYHIKLGYYLEQPSEYATFIAISPGD